MSNIALIHGPLPETNYQYKNVVVKGNFPLASQLVHPDTKYTIKHNFDLEGQTIELPPNCILAIDGGVIYNGTLVGDDSVLIDVNRLGNVLDNVIQTGTWKKQNIVNSINIGDITFGNAPEVVAIDNNGDVTLNFTFPKIPKVTQNSLSATIDPFTLNIWEETPTDIILGNYTEGFVNKYMIRFSTGDVSQEIEFPIFKNSNEEIINIKWNNVLTLEPNATYYISIIDEYGIITKFE